MIQIDEEFKKLIPPLTTEEYEQLEKNILTEGCRERIVTWNRIIVDGHNRFAICSKHNLTFKAMEMDFQDRSAAMEWMINNQFGRRSINAYTRSVLSLKLEDILKERGLANKSRGGKNKYLSILTKAQSAENKVNTRTEIAKKAEVSQGTIHKVKFIEEKANDEIKEKLRAGEMTINAAYVAIGHAEKKASVKNITEHFAVSSLDRRIAIYPNLRHFKLHIAHSYDQQTGKGKVADIILRGFYDAMPQQKQDQLIKLFDGMTLEQIERTNDSRG